MIPEGLISRLTDGSAINFCFSLKFLTFPECKWISLTSILIDLIQYLMRYIHSLVSIISSYRYRLIL